MITPVEQYLEQLAGVPALDGSWFGEALAAAREGDENAKRRISGSCLGLAFSLAERKWRRWDRHLGTDLFDLVQDANAALWNAIRKFKGSTVDEFLQFVELSVRQWIHDVP